MFEESVGPGEEALLAEIQELSIDSAPSRFALCMLDVEEDDGVVLGWGLADGEQAIAYLQGEDSPQRQLLSSPSAARFPRMLRRSGDVRLIWIDAEPTVP